MTGGLEVKGCLPTFYSSAWLALTQMRGQGTSHDPHEARYAVAPTSGEKMLILKKIYLKPTEMQSGT